MDIRRIGILSDTHGVIAAPVLEAVRDCDLVLHAGDIGGAGVLETLRDATGTQVLAVLGNNDVTSKWSERDHPALTGLEETAFVDLPGGRIAMEHGHRIWDTRNYHARLRRKHPGVRMIVYGHTHVRVVDTADDPWVVNPGAAGRERTHGGPSCLVLDTEPPGWSIHTRRF